MGRPFRLLISLLSNAGQMETRLVQAIQDAIAKNKNLKVNILLDKSRGTRLWNDSIILHDLNISF